MIIDMKLKAEDKSSMDAALSPWRDALEIDEIGVIYQPTGDVVISSDGDDVAVSAPIAGWHVNVRTTNQDAASALSRFEVTPGNPVRVWL